MESLANWEGELTLAEIPIPEKLQGPRIVTKVDTTGFYMSKNPPKLGSFLGFPKAADLEIHDPHTFTVIDRTKEGKIWLSMTYKIIT
jgi:hypothetical protein